MASDAASNSNKRNAFCDYCRVTLHLPTQTMNEKLAAEEIIEQFKHDHIGSTYTSTNQSVFTGAWLDSSQTPPIPYDDSIALLIIDMPFSFAAHRNRLGAEMDKIRNYAFSAYAQYTAPQAEIWLIAVPIVVRMALQRP